MGICLTAMVLWVIQDQQQSKGIGETALLNSQDLPNTKNAGVQMHPRGLVQGQFGSGKHDVSLCVDMSYPPRSTSTESRLLDASSEFID